jgi:hypothetical protein
MKKFVIVMSLLIGFALPAVAQELLVNGDFEQDLGVGWKDTVYSLTGSWLFERSDTLGQSSGNAVRVEKSLASYAALTQQVMVPNQHLVLSFDARFRIGGGSSTCWPVASAIVRYLDATGTELGNSKFILHNEYCTWANCDTAHLIEVENPDVWANHQLDIAQEIASNLPGVNAASVAQVRLEIHAYDNGT